MIEWRMNTGSKAAQTKREAWLKKDRGQFGNETPLWDVLKNMPSAKVATVEDMQVHCDYLLKHLPCILDHGMKRRRLKSAPSGGSDEGAADCERHCARWQQEKAMDDAKRKKEEEEEEQAAQQETLMRVTPDVETVSE